MRNVNATRAKARAKADPKASSEKAAIAWKRQADRRSTEARNLHQEGMTVIQISRALAVSRTTVYNLLKRECQPPVRPTLF